MGRAIRYSLRLREERAYVYCSGPSRIRDLEAEADASRKVGLDADSAPLPYATAGALRCELVSARLFPVLRENTGKFANFSPETTIVGRLHVEIQSLTTRIP
jgi:hypothetical protein